jgi:FkbH-like protein
MKHQARFDGPLTTALPAAGLVRVQWQSAVFRETLRRIDLLSLANEFPVTGIRVRVHRNQPFEFVAATLSPFLAYAGYSASLTYTDYADSLTSEDRSPADVEVVWLDFTRYRDPEALHGWLRERLANIRSYSSAPILLANSLQDGAAGRTFNASMAALAANLPGVHICDLTNVVLKLGSDFFDSRVQGIAGTKLSNAACLELSRMFGLVWIPSALSLRVKAILVDLDHSLYEGVLAEDGPAGLKLKEGHIALQNRLLEYRARGVFLGVVSRNVAEDVETLFQQRTDFPIRLEHFSTNSILFLDDNAGELWTVASELPEVRTLHAADPLETARALSLYPGLAGVPKTATDQLRVADLEAAGERTRVERDSAAPADYFRSLRVELTFLYNPGHLLRRLHEMSNKTNQFNTALLRLTEAQVAGRLNDPGAAVVAVALKDRLSDSGVVAALFTRWEGEDLVVDEAVISCRALGRQLESPIVTEAIRGVSQAAGRTPRAVRFYFVEGPRNQPARAWLEMCTGAKMQAGSQAEALWGDLKRQFRPPEDALSVHWENN